MEGTTTSTRHLRFIFRVHPAWLDVSHERGHNPMTAEFSALRNVVNVGCQILATSAEPNFPFYLAVGSFRGTGTGKPTYHGLGYPFRKDIYTLQVPTRCQHIGSWQLLLAGDEPARKRLDNSTRCKYIFGRIPSFSPCEIDWKRFLVSGLASLQHFLSLLWLSIGEVITSACVWIWYGSFTFIDSGDLSQTCLLTGASKHSAISLRHWWPKTPCWS